jgi:ribosomal protein L11 methyltransferase
MSARAQASCLSLRIFHGAENIHAFDLDDVAVKVAEENIQLNPDMTNIIVKPGDLLKNVTTKAHVIVR